MQGTPSLRCAPWWAGCPHRPHCAQHTAQFSPIRCHQFSGAFSTQQTCGLHGDQQGIPQSKTASLLLEVWNRISSKQPKRSECQVSTAAGSAQCSVHAGAHSTAVCAHTSSDVGGSGGEREKITQSFLLPEGVCNVVFRGRRC